MVVAQTPFAVPAGAALRRGARRGTWRGGARGRWACAVAAALWLAGCGYQMESRALPGNARALYLGTITNRTYTGELDVRLRDALRRRLMARPTFRLVSAEASDMVLEVDLQRMDVARPLTVANTNLSSLQYILTGVMTVYRPNARGNPVISTAIVANVKVDFDQPVIETPAVRDELAEDVIREFANRVETILFTTF